MTALPHHNVVSLINARRDRTTAGNSRFPPLDKDPERQRELAEAEREAPMIVDAMPEDYDAPDMPVTAALVTISVGAVLGVAAAVVIIAAFEWLLGAV